MTEADRTTAAPFIPPRPTLATLRTASKDCEGCPLFQHATQTVFGEGPETARVILIGKQPGDKEDQQGRPFEGPAGRLLDQALEEAGVDRRMVYVTNAVKHFKFEPRGKRRIHRKPGSLEIQACKPWLQAEIEVIGPRIVVCMGATAAQALMGPKFRVTQDRGVLLPFEHGTQVMATVHPSSLLRVTDRERRREEYERFVEDLRLIRTVV